MDIMEHHPRIAAQWEAFAKKESLTEDQLEQFEHYYHLILEGNQFTNLTSVRGLTNFLELHFKDSLAIRGFVDVASTRGIVDVGSGAGFPGIPLSIACPDLPVYLVEVHSKRITFLKKAIAALALSNCEVIDVDWRTFLRTTAYPIDYIFARASLTPRELIKALKPGCSYKNAIIVYWASGRWECPPTIEPFFKKEVIYGIKNRTRKLVFLGGLQHGKRLS